LLAVAGTSDVLAAGAAVAAAEALSGKVVTTAAMVDVYPRPLFSPPATSFNVDEGNMTLDRLSTAADTAAVDVMFVRGLKTTLPSSSSSSPSSELSS
jgi:hypothetical protein